MIEGKGSTQDTQLVKPVEVLAEVPEGNILVVGYIVKRIRERVAKHMVTELNHRNPGNKDKQYKDREDMNASDQSVQAKLQRSLADLPKKIAVLIRPDTIDNHYALLITKVSRFLVLVNSMVKKISPSLYSWRDS